MTEVSFLCRSKLWVTAFGGGLFFQIFASVVPTLANDARVGHPQLWLCPAQTILRETDLAFDLGKISKQSMALELSRECALTLPTVEPDL